MERKQLKNVIGVLGNSQKNIYSNKVNTQLGKIQKTGRTFPYVFIQTHLSPDLSGAILICKVWWLNPAASLKAESSQKSLCAAFSPTWSLPGNWCPFHLTLSLNLRAAGVAHYTYGGLDIYGASVKE